MLRVTKTMRAAIGRTIAKHLAPLAYRPPTREEVEAAIERAGGQGGRLVEFDGERVVVDAPQAPPLREVRLGPDR